MRRRSSLRGPVRGAAILCFALAALTATSLAQTCHPEFADTVTEYNPGHNPWDPTPSNVLGNDDTTFVGLGGGGSIAVRYTQSYSTSGDGRDDLCIDEHGGSDCYFICLDPADPFTEAALIAAGLPQGGDFFEAGTFCDDANIDIDALVPGHAEGVLRFDRLMIFDDGGYDNGAEIARLEAKFVCTPPPPGMCVPGFVDDVVSYHPGHNPADNDPWHIIGDTPGTFVGLGDGGSIKVEFEDVYSTTGDGRDDLCIHEYGYADCYFVCLHPADPFTEAALIAAGLPTGGSYYEAGTFCGPANIDIDALVPGFGEGQLRFDRLLILDDGDGSDGAELERIEAKAICPPPVSGCVPGFALAVTKYVPGPNAVRPFPANVLGDDLSTNTGLGEGGRIVVTFGDELSSSGDGRPDLCVDEQGIQDCYHVRVAPADQATEAALVAAGLNRSGAFFQLPDLLCGDDDLDIDASVGGFAEGALRFSAVMIVDDGSHDNGAEIERIEAKFVCPPAMTCADLVIDYDPAGHMFDNDPSDALGAPDGVFTALGQGGCLNLGLLGRTFSTTGNGDDDLFITEVGDVDNYVLGVIPADFATETALMSAGLADPDGDLCYSVGTYSGSVNVDLDALIPGHAAGELRFQAVCLKDDPAGPNDIADIDAVCFAVTAPFVEEDGKIGDFIFRDDDCDGYQDGGEPGVEGVLVSLISEPGGQVVATTVTDQNGKYQFCVPAGLYRVELTFSDQSYTLGPVALGPDTLDSDFDATSKSSPAFVLNPGQIISTIDGGLCPICTGPTAVNVTTPFCGPGDPVLEMSRFVIGSFVNIRILSDLPLANGWLLLSFAPVTPTTVRGCTFALDIYNASNIFVIGTFMTDSNGDYSLTAPIAVSEALAGIELIFQVRLCLPGGPPGPFFPYSDFFTNGIHATIGCP